MSELTPEEKVIAEELMKSLDLVTDEWWKECELDEAIANVSSMIPGPFKERVYNNLREIVRQSFAEGVFHGVCAVKSQS